MTANITPEGLRHEAESYEGGYGADVNIPAVLRAHASALEELARLKAPVEVARHITFLRHNGLHEIAAALESQAAQLAVANARAADRDRYAQGMANWKATAEAKDTQLAERDAELAALKGHGNSARDESTPRTDKLKEPMEWDRFTAEAIALCEQMEKEIRNEYIPAIMALQSRNAALKGHADEMARYLSGYLRSVTSDKIVSAYRAAYPKE